MDKFQSFFKSSFKNSKTDLNEDINLNLRPENNNISSHQNKNLQRNYQQQPQNYEQYDAQYQRDNFRATKQSEFQAQKQKLQSQSSNDVGFYCYFHQKNKITNFCLNKECQMPLCPECIKNHTQKHVQNGEQINYETIDNIVESVQSQLSVADELLNESSSQIKNLQRLSKGQTEDIDNFLEIVRESLYNNVDLFINNYKKETNSIIRVKQEQNDNQINQFIQLNQKLETVLEKYVTSIQSSEDQLKTISQVLKDDYVRICQDYVQDLQRFKETLQKDKVSIVYNDQMSSQLQKDLLKYLKVNNLHKKRDFSNFDPFSQDNLAESIIVNNNEVQQKKVQPIIQYQYTQQYNQNITQPQIVMHPQQYQQNMQQQQFYQQQYNKPPIYQQNQQYDYKFQQNHY